MNDMSDRIRKAGLEDADDAQDLGAADITEQNTGGKSNPSVPPLPEIGKQPVADKAEEPKAEEPKVEEPKVEEPKVEEPKAEPAEEKTEDTAKVPEEKPVEEKPKEVAEVPKINPDGELKVEEAPGKEPEAEESRSKYELDEGRLKEIRESSYIEPSIFDEKYGSLPDDARSFFNEIAMTDDLSDSVNGIAPDDGVMRHAFTEFLSSGGKSARGLLEIARSGLDRANGMKDRASSIPDESLRDKYENNSKVIADYYNKYIDYIKKISNSDEAYKDKVSASMASRFAAFEADAYRNGKYGYEKNEAKAQEAEKKSREFLEIKNRLFNSSAPLTIEPEEDKLSPDQEYYDTSGDSNERLPGRAYPDINMDNRVEGSERERSIYEMSDEELEEFLNDPENTINVEPVAGSLPSGEADDIPTDPTDSNGNVITEGKQKTGDEWRDIVSKELKRRKWNSKSNALMSVVPELFGLATQGKFGLMDGTRNMINAFFDGGPMSLPSSALAETLTAVDGINDRVKTISDHYGILQNADKKIVDSTIKGKLMQAQTKAELNGIAKVYAAINDQVEALNGDPLNITDEQMTAVTDHCKDRIAQLQANLRNVGGVTPAYKNKQERLEAQAELRQYQETLQGIEKRTKQVKTAQRQAETQAKRDEKDAKDAANLKRYNDGTDVQRIAWDLLGTKGGIELNEFGVPVDGQQIAALTKKAWFKMKDLTEQGVKSTDPTYQAYQQLYDANNKAYKEYSEHRLDQGRQNRIKPDGTYGDYVSSTSAVKEANQKLDEIYKKHGLDHPYLPEQLEEMARNGNTGLYVVSRRLKKDPEYIKWHNQLALNRNAINIKDISNKIHNQGLMRNLSTEEQEALIADLTRSQLEEAELRMKNDQYIPFDTDLNKKIELYQIAFNPENYKLVRSMQAKREFLMYLRDRALDAGFPIDDSKIKILDWAIDSMDFMPIDPKDKDVWKDNTDIIREYMKRFSIDKGGKELSDPKKPPVSVKAKVSPTITRLIDDVDEYLLQNRLNLRDVTGPDSPAYPQIMSVLRNRLLQAYADNRISVGTTPEELRDKGLTIKAHALENNEDYIDSINFINSWSKYISDPSHIPNLRSIFGLDPVPPAEEAEVPPKEEETKDEQVPPKDEEVKDEEVKDEEVKDEQVPPKDEEVPLSDEVQNFNHTFVKEFLEKMNLTNPKDPQYAEIAGFAESKLLPKLREGIDRELQYAFNDTMKNLVNAVKSGFDKAIETNVAKLAMMDNFKLACQKDFNKLESFERGRWNADWAKQGIWDMYKEDPELFRKYVDAYGDEWEGGKSPDDMSPVEFKKELEVGKPPSREDVMLDLMQKLASSQDAIYQIVGALAGGEFKLDPAKVQEIFGKADKDIKDAEAAKTKEKKTKTKTEGEVDPNKFLEDSRKEAEDISTIHDGDKWLDEGLTAATRPLAHLTSFEKMVALLGNPTDKNKRVMLAQNNKVKDVLKEGGKKALIKYAEYAAEQMNRTDLSKDTLFDLKSMFANCALALNAPSLKVAKELAGQMDAIDRDSGSDYQSYIGLIPEGGNVKQYFLDIADGNIDDEFSRNFIELVMMTQRATDSDKKYTRGSIFGGNTGKEFLSMWNKTVAEHPDEPPADLIKAMLDKMVASSKVNRNAKKILRDLDLMYVSQKDIEEMGPDKYFEYLDNAAKSMKDPILAELLINRDIGFYGDDPDQSAVEENVSETPANTGKEDVADQNPFENMSEADLADMLEDGNADAGLKLLDMKSKQFASDGLDDDELDYLNSILSSLFRIYSQDQSANGDKISSMINTIAPIIPNLTSAGSWDDVKSGFDKYVESVPESEERSKLNQIWGQMLPIDTE